MPGKHASRSQRINPEDDSIATMIVELLAAQPAGMNRVALSKVLSISEETLRLRICRLRVSDIVRCAGGRHLARYYLAVNEAAALADIATKMEASRIAQMTANARRAKTRRAADAVRRQQDKALQAAEGDCWPIRQRIIPAKKAKAVRATIHSVWAFAGAHG